MQKKIKIISFDDYEIDGEEHELDVVQFKEEASALIRWYIFSLYAPERNLEQYEPQINQVFLGIQYRRILKLRDALNVAAKEASIATATLKRVFHNGGKKVTKSDFREIRHTALKVTEPLLNLMDVIIAEHECED